MDLINNYYPSKNKSMGEFVFDALKSNPNFIGQIHAQSGKEYRFKTMLDLSTRCALWLQKQGVKKGDVVAVSCDEQMDDFVPFLACLYIGAICSPWEFGVNEYDINKYINAVRPKIIFSINECIPIIVASAKKLNSAAKIISFDNDSEFETLSEILKEPKAVEVDEFKCVAIKDPHETAAINFTSGTTSDAKPVQVSHSAYFFSAAYLRATMPENSVALWCALISWVTCEFFILASIVKPATRIVHGSFEAEDICRIMAKYKVTWACLFNSLENLILKRKLFLKYNQPHLETLLMTGSRVSPDVLREFSEMVPNTHVYTAYGSTEAGSIITIHSDRNVKSYSCGKVAPHVQIQVVDLKNGKILEANRIGELYVKTPFMTRGYYELPELTKEVIDENGWLHTGDLGYYDEDGNFFVTDRIKTRICCGAGDVNVGDLENRLGSHPGVAGVAVVGVPHEIDEERPMAFVQKTPGSDVSEQELINLSKNLGKYDVLTEGVTFLDELPRTSSKKIKRRALQEMAKNMMNPKGKE